MDLYEESECYITNFAVQRSFHEGTDFERMPNKKESRPGLVDPLAYYLRNT